jgi:hypothetical protein
MPTTVLRAPPPWIFRPCDDPVLTYHPLGPLDPLGLEKGQQ